MKQTKKDLFRIADLVKRTGVQKETIHFYINKGLLPRPIKTRKNMAYYDESYVERIRFIKELQLKRFLPLNVIKEIISQTDGKLSAQELDAIRIGGSGLISQEELRREYEPHTLDELGERTGLPRDEILEMERCEMIQSTSDEQGEKIYRSNEIKIVEAFAQVRRGGLTKEAGFEVEDMRLHSDLINMLAIEEVKLFGRKFGQRFQRDANNLLPQIAENAVESINVFIAHLRRKKILEAVEALTKSGDSGPGARVKKGPASRTAGSRSKREGTKRKRRS